MSRDKQYIKLINSHRWHQVRHAQMVAEPLCERCKEDGRITPATEVHHRTPVERGKTFEERTQLAYDTSNLESLCHACHKARHAELSALASRRGVTKDGKSKERNRARIEKEKDLFNSMYFSDLE